MSEQVLYFVQQMFNGVTLEAPALIAIGYTMVYGIIGMINFAWRIMHDPVVHRRYDHPLR